MPRFHISRSWILSLMLFLAACQAAPVPGTKTPAASPTSLPSATARPTSTATPPPTPTPTLPLELRVETSDLKGEEVRFWHPLAGAAGKILEDQVKEFNQRNEWGLHVTVTAVGSPAALEDAVESAQPGEFPDAVLAASDQLTGWSNGKVQITDLSLYMNHPTWGLAVDQREGYLPMFWTQDRLKEKQVGLPALRTVEGLIYNRSFAQDLGFKNDPTTPAELLEQFCAAAKDNNRFYLRYGTGGWLVDTTSLTALSWLAAFGADVEPRGADPAWHFSQPKAEDALRFMRDMQSKGCLWVPKNPTPHVYFGDRFALAYSATLQDLLLQEGYNSQKKSKDEWSLIPFPGRDGKPVAFAFGYSYGVFKSSPARQLAAWLFIRWMSQADHLTDLTKSWPSLPVHAAVREQLKPLAGTFPWTVILPFENLVRPAPAEATWRVVRRPLADAFWQVFNLASANQLPRILPMLDAMAADLTKNP